MRSLVYRGALRGPSACSSRPPTARGCPQGRATRRRVGGQLRGHGPGYSDSEQVIGRILPDLDQTLILSTKLGGRPQPFEPGSRGCLMASIDESLRLLHRDHIDLLMVHEPDRPGQYGWWTDWQQVEGPVLDLLLELREQGSSAISA